MKRTVSRYRPVGCALEDQSFDTFTLRFIEYRKGTQHNVCLHLDAGFIPLLAHKLQDQVRQIERRLAEIKRAMRDSGDL